MKNRHKEKEQAKLLFIEGTRTSKEIANLLKVSERTVGKWAAEGKWKEQRALRGVSLQEMEGDLLEIIAGLLADRKKHSDDPQQRVKIADELSKYNKALQTLRRETKLPLAAYINVLEELIAFTGTRKPKFTPELVMTVKEFIDHKATEYI